MKHKTAVSKIESNASLLTVSNSGHKLKGLAASLSLPLVVRCCTSTSTFCCSTNSTSVVLQLQPLVYFSSNFSFECLWIQSSSSYSVNCFTLLSLVWHMCYLACRLPYIVCCICLLIWTLYVALRMLFMKKENCKWYSSCCTIYTTSLAHSISGCSI